MLRGALCRMSDREQQYKEFKAKATQLCEAFTGTIADSLAAPAAVAQRVDDFEHPLGRECANSGAGRELQNRADTCAKDIPGSGANDTTRDSRYGGAESESEALLKLDDAKQNPRSQSSEIFGQAKPVLKELASKISEVYTSYPLLCSRAPQRFAETLKPLSSDGHDAKMDELVVDTGGKKKKKKKKKKKRPPLPSWKRELQIRRGMLMDESASDTSGSPSPMDKMASCKRSLALSFHPTSGKIRWGVSGQLKKQRVHKSLWGKSFLKGRPRGTCAEFHVLNQALWQGENVCELCLYVVDLMDSSPKPRCRNCLYISREAKCFTDELVWDGDSMKHSRYQYRVKKVD